MDWKDKKQVRLLLQLAQHIQTKLWIQHAESGSRRVGISEVFHSPLYHAGLGITGIYFSIQINGLIAFEILVFRFADTGQIAIELYDGEKATALARLDKTQGIHNFTGETIIEKINEFITKGDA